MSPKAPKLLAVIPARGGSKGLPGKNLRPFLGLPLMAHTILFTKLCPQIDRCVVSTDSPEIAQVASSFGAEIPFLRPGELARDETPLWAVIRHALEALETGAPYDEVVLLDPTSPSRLPEDLTQALIRLRALPGADGIVAVSRPAFNPIWHCVVERDGWMAPLIPGGIDFDRRQQVPAVYRINGSLYLWKAEFVRSRPDSWRKEGRHLLLEIPEERAMSIDTLEQFELGELLVRSGKITFPWLTESLDRVS